MSTDNSYSYTEGELLSAIANWHLEGFRILVMTESMPDLALKAACRKMFGKKDGKALRENLYCNYHLSWVDQDLYERALDGATGR
jgi:hypothetical protein